MPRGAYGGGHLKLGAGSRPKSPMRTNLERLRDKKAGKDLKKDELIKKTRAAIRRRYPGGTRPKP